MPFTNNKTNLFLQYLPHLHSDRYGVETESNEKYLCNASIWKTHFLF